MVSRCLHQNEGLNSKQVWLMSLGLLLVNVRIDYFTNEQVRPRNLHRIHQFQLIVEGTLLNHRSGLFVPVEHVKDSGLVARAVRVNCTLIENSWLTVQLICIRGEKARARMVS